MIYTKNKIKLYIFSLILALFFGFMSNCMAAYSEANLEASELDASTTEQINNFYNKLEDGKLGADLDGVSDDQSQENSFNFEDYFDYTKIHFWILLVSVVLVFLILINLFKQLGEMKTQMDEYRQKVFINTRDNVYQASEENVEDEDIRGEEENNIEEEDIEENVIHPHLHIDIESDDEMIQDEVDDDEEKEDVLIDDEEENDDEAVVVNKINLKESNVEVEEDGSAKELKELELDDDEEEILYN